MTPPTTRTILTGAAVHRHGRPWSATDGEILIENGRIRAYGHDGEFSDAARGEDRVVTLPGGRLLPAFFDAHLHLDQGGRFLNNLRLMDIDTRANVLEAIREGASSGGEGWLIGIGLSEHAWPSLDELDRVCPDRPLLIHTRDYHTVLLNSRAIGTLGLTGTTTLPEGGWQDLDESGNPLGILRENAARWAEHSLPKETPDQLQGHLKASFQHLLELGVTGVSDAGDPNCWEPGLLPLEEQGGLPIHVEHWHRCVHFGMDCLEVPRRKQGRLNRFRIKLFIDGALGSRTAWLLEDYADKAGWRGESQTSPEHFRKLLAAGARKGWSFVVHAIGDAGVAEVVDALLSTPAPAGPHRVEHVQHINVVTLQRLAASEIVPSIQPTHRLDDLAMLRARLGDRWRWAYPMRSLNASGHLALGTDWPVVSADPRRTMRAALLPRGDQEGMPGEELSVEDAIRAYTEQPARIAGFPDLGRTEPGTLADLIWLESDPAGDPDAWPEVRIGAVWKEGERVQRENDLV